MSERPTPTSMRTRRAHQFLKGRLTPASARRLPIDAVSGSLERLCVDGGKPAAVALGRGLVRQLPASGKAHRYLVRALLAHPANPADLTEARAAAEVMLALWEDPGVSSLYADVLIAQEEHAVEAPPIAESLGSFASRFPERRLAAIRQVLNYLIAASRPDEAVEIADRLRQVIGHKGYTILAHDIALRTGNTDLAATIEHDVQTNDPSAALLTELRADRALATLRPEHAIDILRGLKPQRSARYSDRFVEALLSRAKAAAALEYLDSTDHGLTPTNEISFRFDCHWLLGDLEGAEDSLATLTEEDLANLKILHRRRDLANALEGNANAVLDWVRDYEKSSAPNSKNIEFLTSAYFDLGATDDVIRLHAQPGWRWQFSDVGLYNVARAHYVQRDFLSARPLLDGLGGTRRHWESQKLISRILLESGDADGAIALRRTTQRADEPLDEVTYHVLLHRSEFESAFAMYLPEDDRQRLSQTFGEQARSQTPHDDTADVFVVTQNGPGDEIQLASTYHSLLARVGNVSATCDPRLEALLSRSFPLIHFVPVTRMSSRRHLGFSHVDQPIRQNGPMFDVLTSEAHELASMSTDVIFGRTLSALAIDAPPAKAYLQPLTGLVDSFSKRFEGRPIIGLVWRSEFNDSMRSIHYVDIDALAGICAIDATIVCLQHDVTDRERESLVDVAGERMLFLDDVDLRNDFEAMAAVTAACDAVVGVGTTTFELAAAVGTDCVMLQPNNFGSWRRQNDAGRDFWHASVRVAVGTYPNAMSTMMSDAQRLLLETLECPNST